MLHIKKVPHLAVGPEVPSAGGGAFPSIQQEDLGQAQQQEHGTQHHHALFELHLLTGGPRMPPGPTLCVRPALSPAHPWRMAPAPSGRPAARSALTDCGDGAASVCGQPSPRGRGGDNKAGQRDEECPINKQRREK